MFRVVSDSTLDADGTVDIGLTLRPPVATPPREQRKPDMLVHSVMICCRSSSVISGICGRDEIVLELLPILRLRIYRQYLPSSLKNVIFRQYIHTLVKHYTFTYIVQNFSGLSPSKQLEGENLANLF